MPEFGGLKSLAPWLLASSLVAPKVLGTHFSAFTSEALHGNFFGEADVGEAVESFCKPGGKVSGLAESGEQFTNEIKAIIDELNTMRDEVGIPRIRISPDNVVFCEIEGTLGQYIPYKDPVVLLANKLKPGVVCSVNLKSVVKHEFSHDGQFQLYNLDWRYEGVAEFFGESELRRGQTGAYLASRKWWDLVLELAQEAGVGEDILFRQIYKEEEASSYDEDFLNRLFEKFNFPSEEDKNLVLGMLLGDRSSVVNQKTLALIRESANPNFWSEKLKITEKELGLMTSQDKLNSEAGVLLKEKVINKRVGDVCFNIGAAIFAILGALKLRKRAAKAT